MRFTFNIRVKTSPAGYWDFVTRTVEADSLKEAEGKARDAVGPAFLAFGTHKVEGAPPAPSFNTSAEVVVRQ